MKKVFVGLYEAGDVKLPKYKYVDLKPREIIHSENLWQEATWEARREEDGRCYFEFLVARQAGGTDTYEISDDEFSAIKSGELKFDDLLKLTDHDPNRKATFD
jgi:hypothetical protein